jgi:hypothetical protein
VVADINYVGKRSRGKKRMSGEEKGSAPSRATRRELKETNGRQVLSFVVVFLLIRVVNIDHVAVAVRSSVGVAVAAQRGAEGRRDSPVEG